MKLILRIFHVPIGAYLGFIHKVARRRQTANTNIYITLNHLAAYSDSCLLFVFGVIWSNTSIEDLLYPPFTVNSHSAMPYIFDNTIRHEQYHEFSNQDTTKSYSFACTCNAFGFYTHILFSLLVQCLSSPC